MKVLYLTFESVDTQPIIVSQVIPLLSAISEKGDVSCDLITVDDDLSVHNIGGHNLNHIIISNKYILLSMMSVLFYLIANRHKYEIIHVRSYVPMLFVLALKPFVRSSIIFDMRGVLPEEFMMRGNSIKYKVYSAVFKFFERYFLSVSDVVVTVSNAFKLYLLKQYSFLSLSRVVCIPTYSISQDAGSDNIINCKLKYFNDRDIELFVYSGSMEVWQKFDYVIEVFEEIARENANSRLIVFTSDVEAAEDKLAKNIKTNMFKVDSLSYRDLLLSLPSCDYGFLFRDDNLVNQVASPIKFSDYLNANLSIIASDNIGDVSSYINDYGLGFVLKSPEDIHNLLPFRPSKHNNRYDEVRSVFTLEYSAKKYFNLYMELQR
jgi:hypothetical protein